MGSFLTKIGKAGIFYIPKDRKTCVVFERYRPKTVEIANLGQICSNNINNMSHNFPMEYKLILLKNTTRVDSIQKKNMKVYIGP